MQSARVNALLPIGWQFIDTPIMRAWVWDTDHFQARISTNDHIYEWIVEDKVAATDPNEPRFLAEGMSMNFGDAEVAVRETIGKSYPPRLGYSRYAGHLATTFAIAGGQRIDFATMDGTRCLVTVRNPDGRERTYSGVIRVDHYVLELDQGSAGPRLHIQPSHIISVTPESGALRKGSSSTWLGMGRTHQGKVVPGCTGVPGFVNGTVDHLERECPVHEDDH